MYCELKLIQILPCNRGKHFRAFKILRTSQIHRVGCTLNQGLECRTPRGQHIQGSPAVKRAWIFAYNTFLLAAERASQGVMHFIFSFLFNQFLISGDNDQKQ